MTNICGECKWLVTSVGKPCHCSITDTIKARFSDACDDFKADEKWQGESEGSMKQEG